MKKSRFINSQILAVPKVPVHQYRSCAASGASAGSKFGSMDASLMSKLRQLQDESQWPKNMHLRNVKGFGCSHRPK